MISCSVRGILWFEGQVKVTAIRFSPAPRGAGSDRCKFEQRLRDYDGDGVWSVALAEGRSYLYPKPSKGLTFVWVKGNLY